ncbi:MAG TPA: PDZ domain-containing protein [Opitutaceae bacterium]|nr:PDZ domain-containing protein [Opitutaceae bacterium]
MKTTSLLLLTLAATTCLSLASAAEPTVKSTQVERKVIRAGAESAPANAKEPVTFLGVEASPVSETLSAQLGLTEGTGLVVKAVVPGSAAVGVLIPHDILLKLDDQILIETRQLGVLVRQKKVGDEITLTLMRKGKEEKVKVTLTQREMPKRAFNFNLPRTAPRSLELGLQGVAPLAPGIAAANGTDVQDVLRVIEDARNSGTQVHVIKRSGSSGTSSTTAAGTGVTIVNAAQSKLISTDDEGTLEMTLNEGKKTLVARSPDGKVVFDGPVTTPEEQAKLPESVRARFEKLNSMEGFSFTPDADFSGAQVHTVVPGATRISLPLAPQI